MRKEVLIAIILGFILGLVITFGIWTANRAVNEEVEETKTEETTPAAEATPPPSLLLTITSPLNESLLDGKKTTITGTTQAEAIIVIAWETDEEIVEPNENGEFETEITLVGGTNEVTITAFSPDGEEATKTLNLVYSTTQI